MALKLMWLVNFVAVLALANGVAALVDRNGIIQGAPAQVHEWTIDMYLAVNLVPSFFAVWFLLIRWLGQVIGFRRTGRVPTVVRVESTKEEKRREIIYGILVTVWLNSLTTLDHILLPKKGLRIRTCPWLFFAG